MPIEMKALLACTAIIVTTIGLGYLFTHRKMDDQHSRTRDHLGEVRKDILQVDKAIANRFETQVKDIDTNTRETEAKVDRNGRALLLLLERKGQEVIGWLVRKSHSGNRPDKPHDGS